LHLIPRYRQRIARIPLDNHPIWVDDPHFNIHYHVRHTALPKPGDERQLKRLSARIMSQQLDRSKPLWEIWIVEGLEGGDRFAMINKVHHCMVDGVSGAELLKVLLRDNPDEDFQETAEWVPRPIPTRTELIGQEVLRRVRTPFSLLEDLPEMVRSPRRALSALREDLFAIAETVGAQFSTVSPTPFNRPLGPHRRFDWLPMQIADLKEVARRLGGSLNDVVLATVAGALRIFLEHRRVYVDDLDIRAFVPVSIRSQEERGKFGNRVSAWVMPLPVKTRDPRERLERVIETTTRLKHSRQALGAELLEELSEWGNTTIFSLGLQLVTRAVTFHLVVTNVPGPQTPLYLLGARLRECYPMVPLFQNHGMGVALFSYAGGIYWGFNADWDLVPDLHDFVTAVKGAFEELQEAALKEPVPARPAAKRKAARKPGESLINR